MRNNFSFTLCMLLGSSLTAQIKTKTITIYGSDSTQIQMVKEYYTSQKFMYLVEEMDNLGVFRFSKYSKPEPQTQVDSIFEVTDGGTMSITQVITHEYNIHGNEVRTQSYYALEDVLHTEKFYYNYNHGNKLMVSGAYDDNSDTLLIYLDTLSYNKMGQLEKKLTYWEGASEPTSGELYTYNDIGQIETVSTIDENEDVTSVLEYTYENAQVRRKKLTVRTNEKAYVVMENFYYNPKGDCILHTITPSEMEGFYKMSYTYYD